MIISSLDDSYHPLSADPWETETCWWAFNVPERALSGWLYALIKPNMHLVAGGVFVWDATGHLPWTLPYYKFQYIQPLPSGNDLTDIQFPESFAQRQLEPLKRYALSYKDRRHISLDLTFDAISAPLPLLHGEPPFARASHFDQFGRITGTMVLKGETIAIDCISVRDRSWGPRPEHISGRVGYSFAMADDHSGFICFVRPREIADDGGERINHGYILYQGRAVAIASGKRWVERHATENWPLKMRIDAIDVEGRTFKAEGTALSRMMLPTGMGVTCNSFLEWKFEGHTGFGEDQDLWRHDQWRAALA